MKPTIVLKFGGTSVSSVKNWLSIIKVLLKLQVEYNVIMVVSALAGVTNLLEDISRFPTVNKRMLVGKVMAKHYDLLVSLGVSIPDVLRLYEKKLNEFINYDVMRWERPSTIARIMSMGEYMSSAVANAILKEFLFYATELDVTTVLINNFNLLQSAEKNFLDADMNCEALSKHEIVDLFKKGHDIIITQGFIGSTLKDGTTTTCLLGRGGSDTTGAILANVMNAIRYVIYKEVDGVFNDDPNTNSNAEIIPKLTYDEAENISIAGAKVLHRKCIEPLRKKEIPCIVRNVDLRKKNYTVIM